MYEKIYPTPQTPYRKRKSERERDFSTLQLETGYDQNILIPTYSSYFIDKRNVRDFLLCNLSEVYKIFIITTGTYSVCAYNPKKIDVTSVKSFPLFHYLSSSLRLSCLLMSLPFSWGSVMFFSNPVIFNTYMHINKHNT